MIPITTALTAVFEKAHEAYADEAYLRPTLDYLIEAKLYDFNRHDSLVYEGTLAGAVRAFLRMSEAEREYAAIGCGRDGYQRDEIMAIAERDDFPA
jgi:hypothetical protein